MSIKNQLLVHPKPLQEESLFGFLLRLAESNELPLLMVLNLLRKGSKYIQAAEYGSLDVFPETLIDLSNLASISSLNTEELERLSMLRIFDLFVGQGSHSHARCLSGLIREHMAYCPECLREKRMMPLLWRYSEYTTCTKHGHVLTSACTNCGMDILFKDIAELGKCPYCGVSLAKQEGAPQHAPLGKNVCEISWDDWLYKAWNEVINSNSCTMIPPNELALRLLFILNEHKEEYHKEFVGKNLGDESSLPTLLQHARQSLNQQRTLHVDFVLKCLFRCNISFPKFLSLAVPETFVQNITEPNGQLIDSYQCQAPWCKSYKQSGSLMKTGTSVKKRENGEKLRYYMICKECGCEYAITKVGEVRERSYFIQFYTAIQRIGVASTRVSSERIGFSKDQTDRCVAYFSTRQSALKEFSSGTTLDSRLLQRFVDAVNRGEVIKSIRKWDDWTSYKHFLVYRFAQDVILATKNIKRSRPSTNRARDRGQKAIHQAIAEMLMDKQQIRLTAVCKIIGVCPETVRLWGGNKIVAAARQQQWLQEVDHRKKHIRERFYEYLEEKKGEFVRTREIYSSLGETKTRIWRLDPKLEAEITKAVKVHNNILEHTDF